MAPPRRATFVKRPNDFRQLSCWVAARRVVVMLSLGWWFFLSPLRFTIGHDPRTYAMLVRQSNVDAVLFQFSPCRLPSAEGLFVDSHESHAFQVPEAAHPIATRPPEYRTWP